MFLKIFLCSAMVLISNSAFAGTTAAQCKKSLLGAADSISALLKKAEADGKALAAAGAADVAKPLEKAKKALAAAKKSKNTRQIKGAQDAVDKAQEDYDAIMVEVKKAKENHLTNFAASGAKAEQDLISSFTGQALLKLQEPMKVHAVVCKNQCDGNENKGLDAICGEAQSMAGFSIIGLANMQKLVGKYKGLNGFKATVNSLASGGSAEVNDGSIPADAAPVSM